FSNVEKYQKFNVIEYQEILIKPIKKKFKSGLDHQEISSVLEKMIKLNLRTMKFFFKDLLKDVDIPEDQVVRILNFLKENHIDNVYKKILENILKARYHYA